MSEPNLKHEPRIIKILLFIGWFVMYYIVYDFILGLNDEKFVQNWTIGLIGTIVFVTFYCVKEIRFLIFKSDKFNMFMISLFLCWILGDTNDFFNAIKVIFLLIYH